MPRCAVLLSLSIALLAIPGCGAELDEDLQCGQGRCDLPNSDFHERLHDGWSYKLIVAQFAEDFDLELSLDRLAPPIWPIPNGKTALLSRFGTPLLFGETPYFHTALDILRSNAAGDDTLVAPISGTAKIMDWNGTPGVGESPYQTVIAIWDPDSHIIVSLMHIDPRSDLRENGVLEFSVTAGEKIGALAHAPDNTGGEALRHTHFSILDGANEIALDPARILPYHDSQPPQVLNMYFLDDQARRLDELPPRGRVDVVIEVFDTDDDSSRHFEVDEISYAINDQDGRLLASSDFCRFDGLYNSFDERYNDQALNLLDFGNALEQLDNTWGRSDIGNPERTFRYALTQFNTDDGDCTLMEDRDGFIEIKEFTELLSISGTVRDVAGHETAFEFVRSRNP